MRAERISEGGRQVPLVLRWRRSRPVGWRDLCTEYGSVKLFGRETGPGSAAGASQCWRNKLSASGATHTGRCVLAVKQEGDLDDRGGQPTRFMGRRQCGAGAALAPPDAAAFVKRPPPGHAQ